MSSVQFSVSSVESVSIGGHMSPRLDVTLDMSPEQMKEALDEFVGNVRESTLREWIDDIASDYLDEIREEGVKLGREQAEAEGGAE